MPPKKNRSAEIDRELKHVYTKRTDMTLFDRASRSPWKKTLFVFIGFFAVLAMISWAGFFFFSPSRNNAIDEKVKVTFDGPSQVKSGDVVSYTVTILNTASIPLGATSLNLRLPKEFQLTSATPAVTSSSSPTWRLGALSPKKTASISFRGVFLAELGSTPLMQANLTYRPSDFNADFQKVTTQTVSVNDSVLTLAVTGPPKVVPEQKLTFTFTYTNTSANIFNQVQLAVLYPPGFIPDSSTPQSSDTQNSVWTIPNIGANGKGSINVTGAFASDIQGNIDTKAQIGFLNNAQIFQLQKEASATTTVGQGDLVTALTVNGKSGAQSANFGDTLAYSLSFRNTGSSTLNGVTLSVNFSFTPTSVTLLSFADAKDLAKTQQNGNQLSWTKTQIRALGKIKPGDQGVIDFKIPIITTSTGLSPNVDYRITADIDTTIQSSDGQTSISVSKTAPLVVTLGSDTLFTSQARYYTAEGVALGGGPLPPQVGQKTTYRVFWKIDNTLHDLTNLKISAPLPSNVVWNGLSSVDAGDLQFDTTKNTLTWTLNWMPSSLKTLTVTFDVTIKPTTSQRGKTPILVDTSSFAAIDKVNNAPLLLTAPALTTALTGDTTAAGKGKVK